MTIGLPILRSLEAARSNAELAEELRDIDGFQGCPRHGLRLGSCPIQLVKAAAAVPDLPIPPGTFGPFAPPPKLEALAEVLKADRPAEPTSAAFKSNWAQPPQNP